MGIRGIVKLVGPYGVVQLRSIRARLVVIVPWVLKRDRGNGVYLCAEHTQEVDLLLAL